MYKRQVLAQVDKQLRERLSSSLDLSLRSALPLDLVISAMARAKKRNLESRTRTTTRSSGPSRSTTPTSPSPSAPLAPSDPAHGTSSSEPATRGRTLTLQATTTLGGGQARNATSFFLWASLFSEPMSACSAALALGGGGIVRRIASPQAPALSSAMGGSLVRLSS